MPTTRTLSLILQEARAAVCAAGVVEFSPSGIVISSLDALDDHEAYQSFIDWLYESDQVHRDMIDVEMDARLYLGIAIGQAMGGVR